MTRNPLRWAAALLIALAATAAAASDTRTSPGACHHVTLLAALVAA